MGSKNSLHESLINQYDHDNLLVYTNVIIRHVTNGNNNEKELKINMGGKVIVTQFDILYKALAEKDEALAEKDAEIARLTKLLEEKMI